MHWRLRRHTVTSIDWFPMEGILVSLYSYVPSESHMS